MRKIILVLFLILSIFITGCKDNKIKESDSDKKQKPDELIDDTCKHLELYWEWEENAICGKVNLKYGYCKECGEMIDVKEELKEHDLEVSVVDATCTEKGYTIKSCKNCNYKTYTDYTPAKGHSLVYVVDKKPTNEVAYGYRHVECECCSYKEEKHQFVYNDYATHGALHVDGINLVDKNNEKFRLCGVSTFGLQWQPQYVNYETFKNLKIEFGINLIRLSLYTSEDGYCTGGIARQKQMYDTLVKGIKYATQLDMYVIVDWHMLGANGDGDNNPLHFKDEAVEFFDKVTTEFSDYDNILFEIMNEPSYCTWADCKEYALEVIPVIRKNMPNAIILVGNPQWSSDLTSVANDPITGYDNIMYTFHFYATDNTSTSKITTACSKNNLPVFVTEHGGMDADGDGVISYDSLDQWYTVLDRYNISMVAWSLSNLSTTSCMFKTNSSNITDVSDSNLKEWGIIYKNKVREVMGLPVDK